MGRLPVIFGYAGVLPFVIFLVMHLITDSEKAIKAVTFLHMSYATIALSFLAGIHWGQAVPSGNVRQLSFAMIPPLAGFFLMGWSIFADPYLPLLAAAGLFWVVYYMDRQLMPLEHIPAGYLKYRFNLTLLVSASLILSFAAIIS